MHLSRFVPTLLQLPLQHKNVADNTFALIQVIGVWSAMSVVAGACYHRNRLGLMEGSPLEPVAARRLDSA